MESVHCAPSLANGHLTTLSTTMKLAIFQLTAQVKSLLFLLQYYAVCSDSKIYFFRPVEVGLFHLGLFKNIEAQNR